MAHEVETMFSARLTPWHQLGVVTDKELTAAEALVTAGLDWKVEKAPIQAMTADGFKELTSHVATVRSTDQSILGVVGQGYEPIQNEKILKWAELLVDTGEASFTTAGSLRDGRIVFACLEVNRTLELPGGDELVPYFVVASSHDGTHAMKAFTSTTRVVCKNTLDYAERNKKSSWTIRHTTNADWRLDAARRMLGMVVGYYDEFTERAHQMINQYVDRVQFTELVDQVVPLDRNATARKTDFVKATRSSIHSIYNGETIGQFRGTGWGALNAVNEFELWSKQVKGNRAERHALRALNRDFPMTQKADKILQRI